MIKYNNQMRPDPPERQQLGHPTSLNLKTDT